MDVLVHEGLDTTFLKERIPAYIKGKATCETYRFETMVYVIPDEMENGDLTFRAGGRVDGTTSLAKRILGPVIYQ